MPNFKSKADFIAFLTETLIPDLRQNGSDCTADDFRDAVKYMRRDDKKIADLEAKIWTLEMEKKAYKLLAPAILTKVRS